MPTTAKTRAIRERLHARRRELLAHYRTMLDLADEEQVPESDPLDSANDRWDVAVLSKMSDTDAHALEGVLAALERLDAGKYGVCPMCLARIEAARLQILPEAVNCFDCAKLVERPRRATA